ncbi:MAG: hypothetical protein COZ32_09760 [Nitrospirae bacterium CG_4_10_14_3_um_filter_53_41]|nr:MAG: hypothetical protein COZ32_09760 [Nitrospirae bacterium CG_4_10_14_3_um_filter_53_41]
MASAGSRAVKVNPFMKRFFIILFIIPVLVSGKVFAEVPGKPVVVITIDAESINHDDCKVSLPEQFDLKIDGTPCGITRMMSICDRHNVKATFFLNVYEYKEYGEKPLKDIAAFMDHNGFDVELHTHPQWVYDKNRNMMYQYSLNEQIQIIRDGKDLLKKWINKEPVIHRAGAYSANEDTLEALRVNGINYDSSFRYAYPTCLLQNLGLKRNYISVSHDVYEIPVNVFSLERSAPGLGFLAPLRGIAKYDIDSVDAGTLMQAIDKGIEGRFDVIVLFLHSPSFIREYTEKRHVPDVVDMDEFDAVLNYIEKRGLRVMTFRSYISETRWDQVALQSSDPLPVVHTKINALKFLGKKAGLNNGNVRQVITITAGVVLILLIVLVSILTKKAHVQKSG